MLANGLHRWRWLTYVASMLVECIKSNSWLANIGPTQGRRMFANIFLEKVFGWQTGVGPMLGQYMIYYCWLTYFGPTLG